MKIETIISDGVINDKELDTPENRVALKAIEAMDKQIQAEGLEHPGDIHAALTTARYIAVNTILCNFTMDKETIDAVVGIFIDDLNDTIAETIEPSETLN